MRKSVFAMAGVLVCIFAVAVFAGSLDAPGGLPTDNGVGAMYTLESIYQRLATGAAGTKRVGPFAEPVAGPAATGHTLDQVMGLAPAVDNTNGAGVADVATGKKFWGLKSGSWGVQTGTGTIATVPAPVPKTGQTTPYSAGDDGTLQKGVASPSPRFTEPSPADGTVKDNLTGLIWLKNANCAAVSPKTWTDALTSCNSLASGTCGLTDGSTAGQWRLPNRFELESLLDLQNSGLALPSGYATFFTGVQTGYYWSATTYAGYTPYAWRVDMDDSSVYGGDKSFTYYVWPVR